jgi:septal ring factor EnvC (AmiA/AmiB activator)
LRNIRIIAKIDHMRFVPASLLCLPLAASALAQEAGPPLDTALKQARAEQAAAEKQAARLEAAASKAQNQAERLRAQQQAAAQQIEAAEARITAEEAQLRLASAYVALSQRRLAEEQRPAASLLAGLAMMGRRPPLLALADQRSTDELVKVRILLDSTLPAIRSRSSRLSADLVQAQRLRRSALEARAGLLHSRQELAARRTQFAELEQKTLQQAVLAGGQALSAGDVALAAGEDVERLRGAQAAGQSARTLAWELSAEEPAPARPIPGEGPFAGPPFAYRLPADALVTEGLGAVNASGVRSRGLTLATSRGATVSAPADGIVRFSGPFRDYDGVLIIDHGGGWMSLIVNVASDLRPGRRIQLGEPVGRALGPLQVELSQNGHRISPSLIAGSSRSLSKAAKGR